MRASVLLSEAAKDATCVSEAKELGGALDLDDNLLDRSGPVTDGMIGDPEAYAGRVVVGDVSRRWICGATIRNAAVATNTVLVLFVCTAAPLLEEGADRPP